MPNADTSPVPDYMAALRLDGRGMLVFGAGQGIGRQAAHALRQAGAQVVCIDKNEEAARQVAGEVDGHAIVADITRRESVETCFETASRMLPNGIRGIIDIVGEARLVKLVDATDATWDSQFDIVLRHAFLVAQIGSRILKRSGGGAITFVGSISGRRMLSKQVLYGAAKAGLHHLVRSASVELAGDHVRINAVAPGFVRTPRLQERIDPETWTKIERTIPVGRVALPHEIARALLFLTSDLAGYVTGQVIGMDGGLASATPLPVLFEHMSE
jgi:NAD(P)-dependent dehydrogenase (short-subunit alcohol dehydrogenase family)